MFAGKRAVITVQAQPLSKNARLPAVLRMLEDFI
jgi:hypothetical protein